MSVRGTTAVRRRTQEERRATTRTALLEAALSALVEKGYAGFTTTEVCSRANLSQGALFKHFPTKHALLAAMTEHLFAELRAQYEERFRSLSARGIGAAGALRPLWEIYSDSRLLAAYDLYAAARTDPVLRRALAPVVEAHITHATGLVASLFGATAQQIGSGRFRAAAELVNYALQGIALHELTRPSPELRERVFHLVEDLYGAWLLRVKSETASNVRTLGGRKS